MLHNSYLEHSFPKGTLENNWGFKRKHGSFFSPRVHKSTSCKRFREGEMSYKRQCAMDIQGTDRYRHNVRAIHKLQQLLGEFDVNCIGHLKGIYEIMFKIVRNMQYLSVDGEMSQIVREILEASDGDSRFLLQKELIDKMDEKKLITDDMFNIAPIWKLQKNVISEMHKYDGVKKNSTTTDFRHLIKPCVVPIVKKVDDEIYLDKRHVNRLDMINTLGCLCSKDIYGNNVLISEKCSFYETDEHIVVNVNKEDLYRIQYGWGCRLMCYRKTLKWKHFPNFPWIIRAFIDPDDTVFLQGVHCLVDLFARKWSTFHRYGSDHIKIMRRLPEMLLKFGMKTGKGIESTYVWKDTLFEEWSNLGDRFVGGLMVFLIPPVVKNKEIVINKQCRKTLNSILVDEMYIREDGIKKLQELKHLLPGDLKYFLDCVEEVNNEYLFSCDRYPDLYLSFYHFVFSCSPSDAVCLFMSVYNKRPLKNNYISNLNLPDKVSRHQQKYRSKKYQGCYQELLTKYEDMNKKRGLQNLGLQQLLYFIEYNELRGNWMKDKQKSGNAPENYFTEIHSKGYGKEVKELVQYNPEFTPWAQLQRFVTKDGSNHVKATDMFPVHKLNDNMYTGLKDYLKDTKSIFE
jgi:hypothetical protein